MTDAKTVINRHLAVLLGLEVSSINHAADMLTIQFGQLRQITTRRGSIKLVGEWALHVACNWHFDQFDRMIASQKDLHTDDTARRTAEHLNDLLVKSIPIVVKRVYANASGAVRINLSHNMSLTVTPTGAAEDEDWRLFTPGSDGPHFVIEGGKIDPDSLSNFNEPVRNKPWWKRWR